MEPVSFTVGVLGVASLFETCLNLYDKRFDAKDYPIDLAGLYLIYDIERIRFSELRNRLDFLTSSGHSPSMGGVDAAIAKDRGISEDALRDQCEDVIKHLRDITKRGEKIFERHSPRLGSGALSRASSPVSQGSQSSAAEEWNAPSTNGLGLTFSGCPQSSPGKLGSLRGEGPTPVSGGSLNVGLSIPGSRSSSSQSSPHAHSCPPISCETPIVIEPSPSKLSYAFVLKSSANGSHTYTADTRLKSKPKKKIWGILSWVASDKRRLSEVVSNMCQFNDKLAKLLPPEEKEVLDLSVLVSHLSTHSDERELKHLLEVGGSRYAYIQKTAKVKQLQLRLQSVSTNSRMPILNR